MADEIRPSCGRGRIVQRGAPYNIYQRPGEGFREAAAFFEATINVIRGHA